MKSFAALSIALFAMLQGALADTAAPNSTVTCAACPPASSTPDIVTRSPVPTTPCTAPALITMPAGTGALPNSTATMVPPVAAAPGVHGLGAGTGAVLAVAVGAVLMA